jgi:hypothetical protein
MASRSHVEKVRAQRSSARGFNPAERQCGEAAMPARITSHSARASFPHRVRQSGIAAMPPRVAFTHAKREPFAHIGCGRAAKPRFRAGLLSRACAQRVHRVRQSGAAALPRRVFSNARSASRGVHRVALGSLKRQQHASEIPGHKKHNQQIAYFIVLSRVDNAYRKRLLSLA